MQPSSNEPLAAQDLFLATQSGEYAAGYDAGVQAVWDKWVCSACGVNHDEDESAACEGADVISFADWYGRASDFLSLDPRVARSDMSSYIGCGTLGEVRPRTRLQGPAVPRTHVASRVPRN